MKVASTDHRQASIAFQTDKSLSDYGRLAARAEELGFDVVSVYNDLFFQPVWPALHEMARHTSRIRLGPSAVNPFTCHPINLAGHISLLEEASGGRAYLGLARGSWLDQLGMKPSKPIKALSEALGCIRHLLSGAESPYQGELFPIEVERRLNWPLPARRIPFQLGSWGPRTIAACIDWVDEVKAGGSSSPRVVRRFDGMIASALPAHRKKSTIATVVGSVTVVDEDGESARAMARREVSLYLPVTAQMNPKLEIEPECLQRIDEAIKRGDAQAAARLVPDIVLKRVALAGTPAQVTQQVLELYDAGANRIEFGTPHGLTEHQGLELLGGKVLKALKRELGTLGSRTR